MGRVKLTDKALAAGMAAGEWWDILLPGFGVRISDSGRATFFIRYRLRTVARRLTIGHYPVMSLANARDSARAKLVAAAEGRDPKLESRPETVGYLIDAFVERYAKVHKKSWAQDKYVLDKYLRPIFGNLRMGDLRRRDVIGLLDDLVAAGTPANANSVHSMMRRMFRWAVEREMLERSPLEGLSRPAPQRSRDRFLSEQEIVRLLEAIAVERHRPTAALFKVALLTGQRKGELLGMRESQINGRWWTIPAELSKNKLAHRVYLSDQTLEALEEARPRPDGLVFVSPTGKPFHRHSPGKVAERLARRCGFVVGMHDLRRSMATHMSAMGIPRLVIAKCLNHTDSSVTAIYDRASYDEQKRDAWTRWGLRVASLADPQPTTATLESPPSSTS